MSYPTWPMCLPQQPLLNGFTANGVQPVSRMQMESGPDRVTRISSTTVRNNTQSFYLATPDQRAAFWSFYDNEANAGANWVLIPTDTGNGIAPHLCRIASYPTSERYGRGWRISFQIETDEQHIDWGA